MDIYHFDRTTRTYSGKSKADPNREQPGDYIVPAFATALPPPEAQTGMVAVFNLVKGDWEVVAEASIAVDLGTSVTVEQMVGALRTLVNSYLDHVAGSYGFDSMADAVSYAEEPAVAEFQRRGRALRAWRSLVWAAFEPKEAAYLGGTLPVPSPNDLIAALPKFVLEPIEA